MAVIIGSLARRDSVVNDDIIQIEGAWGVHTLTQDGQTYVYACGLPDDGVSVFRLEADGSLSNVQNIRDAHNPAYLLNNAANFTSVKVAGVNYLYVNSANDNGINVFRVGDDGSLSFLRAVADDLDLQLSDSAGRTAVARSGQASFLIATGKDDNGISVFQVGSDGGLTNTDNILNTATNELDDALDVAVVYTGGRTFFYVTGEDDNGVSGYRLLADGTTAEVVNIDDASDPALQLQGAAGIATAVVDGTSYLVAAGLFDDGLSVFEVAADGGLSNVFNLEDGPDAPLGLPHGVTTFTLGGESFAAVSGVRNGTLSVFHVGTGGILSEVTTYFDNAASAIGESYYNAFASLGGVPFLIATGFRDDGLSSFEIGGRNDRLSGTGGADLMLGLGGNDRLVGGPGLDRLVGGTGSDTYVLRNGPDAIEERAGGGRDTVVSFADHTLGAHVEDLNLRGTHGLSGTGNATGNRISGTDLSDRIDGRAGRDTLIGRGGHDELDGGAGHDLLRGGAGRDALSGGSGRDLLFGGRGADEFVFGSAADSRAGTGLRDRVLDFGHADRIDLASVDAVRGRPGNQSFSLDDGGSFEAGEIRQVAVSKGLLLRINLDGDSDAEMSILLEGFGGTLTGADFDL